MKLNVDWEAETTEWTPEIEAEQGLRFAELLGLMPETISTESQIETSDQKTST